MIRIERPAHDGAIEALARKGRSGLSESETALWFYENAAPAKPQLPAKPTKAPKFAAYRSAAVKTALADLFGSVCAYCESAYTHLHPMEVEHYRPKGGYLDNDGILRMPGYYWLAADWYNLLPSCVDCNRERRQLYDDATGKAKPGKLGKANKFPLEPGSPRATKCKEEKQERPLLLNPCTDQPGDHLAFYADGHVFPAPTAQEAATPRGFTTIDVCGLHRAELIAIRRQHALSIRAAMRAVFVADRNVAHHPGDPVHLEERNLAEIDLDETRTVKPAYKALTRAMFTLFDAVRPLAADHHIARRIWEADRTAAHHDVVLATAKNIRDFYDARERDQSFLRELLAQVQIKVGGTE